MPRKNIARTTPFFGARRKKNPLQLGKKMREVQRMKAAILEKGILEIREVPKPSPKNEEALVRMITAGVCHSDLHLVRGDWPRFAVPFAIPLGHEGIGIVEELGPGAEKFIQKGDRVILGLGGAGGGYWCGACEYCLSGRPRLCKADQGNYGNLCRVHFTLGKIIGQTPG